jgi:hypothetical protein
MSVSASRLSLYKRGNGIYYMGYYLGGRRRWKSTGSGKKPEALKTLTQFHRLLQGQTQSVSLARFVTESMAFSRKNHAAKTHEPFSYILPRFALSCLRALHSEKSPPSISIHTRPKDSRKSSQRP